MIALYELFNNSALLAKRSKIRNPLSVTTTQHLDTTRKINNPKRFPKIGQKPLVPWGTKKFK